MILSYLGLSEPIKIVNNLFQNKIISYRRANPGMPLPLTMGGVHGPDLGISANFASQYEMSVYINAKDLFDKSDIIFVFLPEKSLRNLAKDLKGHNIRDKIICHFSPAFDSDVLDFGPENTYISFFIPTYKISGGDIPEADDIFVEGYGIRFYEMGCIMDILGINYVNIERNDKTAYLAAANFMNEIPKYIEQMAYKLMKISLHNTPNLCDELISKHHSSEYILNSYNPISAHDALFVRKQSDFFASMGLDEFSSLYAALLLSQRQNAREESTSDIKIKKICRKLLKDSLKNTEDI
ncbi:MAG: hypothetical protein J6B23_05145 [Clostridia bacterium]|nr:hypothetical protein [Clostridia bacterium]